MYVILGGTGRVGRATAMALLDRGEPVTVVTHSPDKAADWKDQGADIAVADVYDADALRAAFGRGKRLFILNPPADPAKDIDAEEHTTIATILSALEGARLEKIVALSTYGAHGGEPAGDLTTLHALEEGLNAQPIPTMIMRAAYYMSNWDMMLETARTDGVVQTFFPPRFKLPMVAAQDLGAVAARFLTEPVDQTGLRFVEGPEHYSSEDVAAVLSDLLNRTVEVQSVPADQWVETYQRIGFSRPSALSFARMMQVTVDGGNSWPNDPLRGSTTLRAYLTDLMANADDV